MSSTFFAQGGDYDDLLEMLVDEKYEKLLYRAEKYTMDDKTTKHALPYLYMARAFYQISLKPEDYEEKWSDKSLKNSLKYAVKYVKKDKELEYYAEHSEFFDDLRSACISEAEVYNDQEKYTKSKGYYKSLTDIDENDAGAWLMQGYTYYMSKSKKDAELSFESAKAAIESGACERLTEVQLDLFKTGLIYVSEQLNSDGDSTQAKAWLELGYEYFKDDKEYNVTYQMIVG
jgi:tetratricopeptide (TPR) repeat protein